MPTPKIFERTVSYSQETEDACAAAERIRQRRRNRHEQAATPFLALTAFVLIYYFFTHVL